MADDTSPDIPASTADLTGDMPYTDLGQSGLRRQGEHLYEEWLPDLQGQKAIKAYREMHDNDTIVGAFLFAIEMLLRQIEWTVEPADETEEAKKWAEFVDECLLDMEHTWDDHIGELLSMLVYGWSWFEVVYKKRKGPDSKDSRHVSKYSDGKIGWRKLSIRSQDSLNGWVYDDSDQRFFTFPEGHEPTGALLGMRQLAPPKYDDVVIPKAKSVHYITKSFKESPEGRSILRNCWIAFYRKKRLESIEGIGVERDLAGLPMAGVDAEILKPDATPEQKAMLDAVKRLVANVRRDMQEGIVYPMAYDKEGNPLFKFELLSTAGSRQLDINAIITRYDQRIAMTVLADFILLGTQNVGSWALSKDKSNLFGLAISAWSQSIADTFNRQAISALMQFNKVKPELWPTLKPGDPQSPDLEAFANFLKTAAEAGMPLFPDSELEAHVRRTAKLPEPSEEAEEMFEEQAKVKLEQQKALLEGQQLGVAQLRGDPGAEEGADGQSPQGAPQNPAQGRTGANPGTQEEDDEDPSEY